MICDSINIIIWYITLATIPISHTSMHHLNNTRRRRHLYTSTNMDFKALDGSLLFVSKGLWSSAEPANPFALHSTVVVSQQTHSLGRLFKLSFAFCLLLLLGFFFVVVVGFFCGSCPHSFQQNHTWHAIVDRVDVLGDICGQPGGHGR